MKKEHQIWFDLISMNCVVTPINERALLGNAIFAFKFPLRLSAHQAFLSGESDSTVRAFFLPDNVAQIIVPNSIKETTWLSAYNQIAKSSFGTKVIPLPPDITEAFPSFKEASERIDKWLKKLNELPMVFARLTDSERSQKNNDIIVMWIPASWEQIQIIKASTNFIAGDSQAFLNTDGKVRWFTGVDSDEILKNHTGDFESWGEFYNELCIYLNEQFALIPEAK